MKNANKLFGIFALVVIIGFSMVGCKMDNEYDLLNGDWENRGFAIVTFINDKAVFKEITGGNLKIALDRGNVSIGDPVFKDIMKLETPLRWHAKQRLATSDGTLGDWDYTDLTLSADHNTLTTRDGTTLIRR
jgi:hypothetical protein